MVKTESEYINEELIEATYLWCYKRLHHAADAEDLTQDILLEAVKALKAGKTILSFYSWFWGMAENRFKMFLKMKEGHAVLLESFEGSLPCEEDGDHEETGTEEIDSLNYSISRLSRLHREIIILFYLKEMKISQISDILQVPEGTVKRRLTDARAAIKKGMKKNTMENCGRASYAPAELDLMGSYSLPDYWNQISDIMAKQIFVACRKEAKSIRQISDEICVAPVYFEEKLKYLLDNKFLKETSKGMYLTDFCIFPRRKLIEFEAKRSEVYENIGKDVTEAILLNEKRIRDLDFYGNDFPIGKLLWILYCFASEAVGDLMLDIYQKKWEGKISKTNGKNYRVTGSLAFPNETFDYGKTKSGSVGWSNLHCSFRTSFYRRIEHANLYQHTPFSYRDEILSQSNADLFMRIFDDPCLALTPNEEETVANLISLDYLHKSNGKLYPSMPMMTFECKKKIDEILKEALFDIAVRYEAKIAEIGESILLPEVRKDLYEEFAHFVMLTRFFPVGYLYYYGQNAESKPLEIPEDYSKSSLGICIYYTK